MDQITVRPGSGLTVQVISAQGTSVLPLTDPHRVYARIDVVYVRRSEEGVIYEAGIIPGEPSTPPLRTPYLPDGYEAVAGVLVRPPSLSPSDLLKPEDLISDPG
jgi:hypothetical protein